MGAEPFPQPVEEKDAEPEGPARLWWLVVLGASLAGWLLILIFIRLA